MLYGLRRDADAFSSAGGKDPVSTPELTHADSGAGLVVAEGRVARPWRREALREPTRDRRHLQRCRCLSSAPGPPARSYQGYGFQSGRERENATGSRCLILRLVALVQHVDGHEECREDADSALGLIPRRRTGGTGHCQCHAFSGAWSSSAQLLQCLRAALSR